MAQNAARSLAPSASRAGDVVDATFVPGASEDGRTVLLLPPFEASHAHEEHAVAAVRTSRLMEAAGIEPASAVAPYRASTSVVRA